MKELKKELQKVVMERNVDYAKAQEIIDILHENGITIMVVHNGEAHKDDMLACAVYEVFTGKDICVIRTRDSKIIAMADIIVDVGGLYDGYRYFDHHQQGAPAYPNGVKYAAVGMVLERVCQDPCIKDYLLEHALYAVQAGDNGQQEFRDQFEDPFDCLRKLNVSWRENLYGEKQNANFMKGVEFGKAIIAQMVEDAYAAREMEQAKQTILDAIEEAIANGKNYIVLNRYLPWHETVIGYNNDEHTYGRVYAVVFMSKPEDWKVQVVPVEFESFDSWIKLDPDYCKSMDDFIFCHQGRFIAGFKSKESAVKVAEFSSQENPWEIPF